MNSTDGYTSAIIADKYQYAVELFNKGSLTETESILLTLHEENSKDYDVLNFLGIVKLNKKKYEDAAECFKQVVALCTYHKMAFYNLGLCYQNLEDYNNALYNYQKTIELDPAHFDAINNMGVIYLVQKDYDNAVSCFNFCLSIRPDDSSAYNNLGNTYFRLEKFAEAEEYYNKAISFEPGNPLYYFNLGSAYQKNNEDEKAIEYYKKALKVDAEYDDAYNSLALVYIKNSRFKDAEECFAKINQNKFSKASLYTNRAVSKMTQGLLQEALELLDEALTFEPEYPEIHYNKSHILLLLGDYANGLKEYEWRIKRNDFQGKKITKPLPHNTDINGLRIVIKAEQGLGDSIQFARYIKNLKEKGACTIFECDIRLHPLFTGLDYIDRFLPFENEMQESEFDYEIYLLSLPEYFNTGLETIPAEESYLKADEKFIKKWKKITGVSEKLKAGIVWAGNPKHTGDKKRSCSVKDFIPLFEIDGVDYFVLQKGEALAQAKDVFYPLIITDSYNNGFQDLAAAIHCLDLVITVDTSIAHLAGALGKETWLLLPYMPDWRWIINRNDTPWYPTMKLFRQVKPDDWAPVFANAAQQLKSKLAGDDMNYNLFKRPYENIDKYFDIIESHVYPEIPSGLHTDITNQVIKRLVTRFAFPKEIKILDIGCGQGPALEAFASYGYNPTGITLGDEDVIACRQKGFDVLKMDQTFLEFDNDEFDMLWARHVLEHSVMPLFTLMEYHRVMKPGGIIYIEVPAAETCCHHEDNPNHYSVLSAGMWKALFKKAGFLLLDEFTIPLQLAIGNDEYLCFICRCEKAAAAAASKESMPLYLGLSGGENFGWGICSKYIKEELSKKISFSNIDEQAKLLPGSRIKGKVFHAITNVSLESLRKVYGDVNIGYTFFENELNEESRKNSTKYDLILAGSTWCKEKLKEQGINSDVLLQGIDPEIFYPGEVVKNKNLFTVFSGGKFEYRKGQDLILKTFKIIQEKYKDIILINAWYNYWPEIMQTMYLTKHINFEMKGTSWEEFMNNLYRINDLDASRIVTLPLVPNSKLRELYLKTDIGLFPNRCEGGTNLVLMEYMACGRPVIASYNSGHTDIITERNSLKLNSKKEVKLYGAENRLEADWSEPEVDEIVAQIEFAYHNRDMVNTLGRTAADDLSKLTWAKTAENLLKYLE
jgi:tetratricopeptide (TPR) repeat protein/glycosyltransferase involved in cell wall biosynthesis